MNIEKGIPIPPLKGNRESVERGGPGQDIERANLLAKMEVGDSIRIIDSENYQRFQFCTTALKRLTMKAWTCRVERGGWRIWRVK